MNLEGVPLARIRQRIHAAGSSEAIDLLVAALRNDPRSGARALVEAHDRRAQASRADAQRVAALFARRRALFEAGAFQVAGVDEVGMGPLAGPVVAAAVVLPAQVDLPGLDDSKRVRPAARERLDRAIREQALDVSVGEVAPDEIDRINIYRAGLEAMRRAVSGLGRVPDHVLVDARTIPGIRSPQTGVVGGDASDGSIAAASIVAKVHRDALMRALDARHPGYGFADHAGYGTPRHLEALERLGPSPVHRRSFAPVARHARR